jgi:TonB family protein
MGSISTQSIFQSYTSGESGRTWRSYLGSVVVHGLLIVLALTITIPAMRPVRRATERFTLIAPVLPEYKPKIPPPPVHVRIPPPVAPTPAPAPPKFVQVPAPKPIPPKPVVLAAAPEIPNAPQTPPPVVLKPELPVAPKPPVQTGVFQQPVEVAKNTTPEPKLSVGGFGDPNGAKPENAKPAPTTTVGAFDAPSGSATNTGRSQGTVKQGAFGSAGVAGSAGNNRASDAVKLAGFGDSAVTQPHPKTSAQNAAQSFTPVEVLSKPRPVYSTEARNLRLEGHVSLEVVFLSTGSVRVLRVVHGLGHGLDEAAEQAALQVRFKPATRGGVPVDTDATIDITFELT